MREKIIVYLGFNNPLKHKRGVENVILFQSKALKNVEKYYIFFDDENTKFQYQELTCIGIKHNVFRFFNLNKKIFAIGKNKKILIHSHNYLMSFFLLKKTDIFTVHDGLYYLSSKRKHKLKNLFIRIEKSVYLRSKKVHFISQFAMNQALYEKKLKKEIIIMNTTPYEQMESQGKIVKEAKIFKLFSVRSIEERARIDLLIDLAEKLSEKVIIEVAGKGPLLSEFREKIKNRNLKNIVLFGYLSDEEVLGKYHECNAVIVTAEFGEGFGLPIIEGYMANKPVIASNRCAIPEIIINRKFLFENNICSILSKVKMLSETKEENFKYRDYYLKNFSYSVILNQYKKMYDEF